MSNHRQRRVALDFHPIADLFPLLEGDEFEAFKADVAENEQQEEIDLHEGKILDGRNRYRACIDLKVKPKTRIWNGKGSPLAFVISKNLKRRHLNESQRGMVAARAKPLFEEEAARREKAGKKLDPVANLPQANGKSRDQAAALVNVSPRTVEHASTVLSKGVPELARLVDTGEVAVSAAAELARLPKAEQRRAIHHGPDAVRTAAKIIRKSEKPSTPWRGWHRFLHDLYCAANSIRDAGGVEKLCKGWAEEEKKKLLAELRTLIQLLKDFVAKAEQR